MTFLRVSQSITSHRTFLLALTLLALGFAAPMTVCAKPTKAPKSRKAIVRAQTVRLRAAPGKKAALRGLLDGGRVARVLEKRDGWAKLKLESGTTGWVRADLLAINKKKTKDSGAFAKQHPVIASAPRRVRRAKQERAEPMIARRTAPRKPARIIAAKKSAMKPMIVAKSRPVSKPRVVAKPRIVAVAPVRIARVTHRVVPTPTPQVTPQPMTETQTDVSIYETATLREGIGSQMLAEIPASAPVATVALPTDAVPTETAPSNTSGTRTETMVASAPIPRSKPIKGKVAPSVKVPIERASRRGDRIVNRALTYRGVPYRMGATGRGAFDCSSFTRYVLQMSGENLPRTAAEQYRKGTPVDKSDMRAGDLVFFKNTYKRGVSHVGIYMGGGKFIHASSHGGVKTSNLSNSYFTNHWAGARRPNITQEFK